MTDETYKMPYTKKRLKLVRLIASYNDLCWLQSVEQFNTVLLCESTVAF